MLGIAKFGDEKIGHQCLNAAAKFGTNPQIVTQEQT